MDKFTNSLKNIEQLAQNQFNISDLQSRVLISEITNVFSKLCIDYGYDKRQVLRITTKIRDAGRRSPPWKPTSSRVPGRPQDGIDGNRINRWLLAIDHKFYADEINYTV